MQIDVKNIQSNSTSISIKHSYIIDDGQKKNVVSLLSALYPNALHSRVIKQLCLGTINSSWVINSFKANIVSGSRAEEERPWRDSFNEENSRQKSSLHSLISRGWVRDNVLEYLHFLLGLFAPNPVGLLEFLSWRGETTQKLMSSRASSLRRDERRRARLSFSPPFFFFHGRFMGPGLL